MEATSEVKRIITLTMTEEEASWLMGYVQNAGFDGESYEDGQMRHTIFNILQDHDLHPR